MKLSDPLRKMWDFVVGRPRRVRPFDFTKLDFPGLEVDHVFKKLRLAELGQQNGSHEIPATTDIAFDGPQLKIVQFVDGEIADSTAAANVSLIGFNNRISGIDLGPRFQEAEHIVARLKNELASLHRDGIETLRSRWVAYSHSREEFSTFQRDNRLSQMPDYPESHLLHWAFLAFFVVAESIGNSYFFAQGSPFGLALVHEWLLTPTPTSDQLLDRHRRSRR